MIRRIRIHWKLTLRNLLRRRKCQHTRFADEAICWDCGKNQQAGWL